MKNIKIGFVTLFILLIASCKKEENQQDSTNNPPINYETPVISIDSVVNINNTSVRVHVSIASTGGGDVLENLGAYYDVLGQNNNVYVNTSNLSNTVGSGYFDINNLQPSTNYQVSFYAFNSVNQVATDSISFVTLPYVIGQTFNGAKCAYILQPGDIGYDPFISHGFLISWNNYSLTQIIASSVTNWGSSGTLVGCNQTAVGSGGLNSNQIWGSTTSGPSAIRYCFNYNGNNPYATPSEWFLPSTEELYKIYLNRAQIGLVTGASSTMNYWSSTEVDIDKAMVVNLSLGSQYSVYKTNPVNQVNVLAIKYF